MSNPQKTGFSEKPLFYSSYLNFLKKKIDPPLGGKKRKRVKREKREKGLQSPPSTAHHPKTEVAEADAAVVEAAESGTAATWIVVPRTAPPYAIIIIIIIY